MGLYTEHVVCSGNRFYKKGGIQMICPNCGFNNPDRSKFCSNCGAPLQPNQNAGYNVPPQQQNMYSNGYQQYNPYMQNPPKKPFYEKTWVIILSCIFLPPLGVAFLWMASKPKKLFLRIIVTLLLTLYFCTFLFGVGASSNDGTTTQEESTSNIDSDSTDEQKEETLSPDEYKAQCEEASYNDVMRNPDDYAGKKLKITVQIFSVSDKWSTGKYYKAYTDDGSGHYFDKMVWIFDKRDEDADGYVKLLEDDIVTFYGEFNGLQETENSLNGEKGEDFSLDAYYADIVEEAQ